VSRRIEPRNTTFLGKVRIGQQVLDQAEKRLPTPAKAMKQEVSVVYGEYLANSVTNCVGCHSRKGTQQENFTSGPKFSVGISFEEV